jgi:hypothetical protein
MANRGFSLNRLRKGMSQKYDELAHGSSQDANVRSLDDMDEGRFKPFTYQQEDFDRTEAPKDAMRKYWRQYETTPIVRKPISSFASQVMEPGYYLESEELSEEELNDLQHWLERAAIIEGMPGKDFRLLAKKAIVQREVRGTSLIEKAPDEDNPEKLAGLKLINPETMEAVTRPGQSILLAPEDNEHLDDDDLPETPDGDAAAYLQDISETDALFGTPIRRQRVDNTEDTWKIAFRRDEVIKLTRDADVGDIFGTSRIEAVSERIEGLRHKLQDNDEAIASKAYPLWLFMFGSEEEPWGSDDINDFMSAHEMENFHPGMKQGVRGDVDVETVSGEVAEIAEYLEFDINWIMSAMPMPKFALGAFSGNAVGQIGGVAQQRDVQRQIMEARRELENEFTPLIQEVAEQMGHSDIKDLKLRIGKPGEEELPIGTNEQIIRYISGSGNDGQQQSSGQTRPNNQPKQPPDGQPQNVPATDSGPNQSRGSTGTSGDTSNKPLGIDPNEKTPGVKTVTGPPEENAPYGAHVWDESNSIASLSMNDQRKRQVADAVFDTLQQARDDSLDSVSGDLDHAARTFEQTANTSMNNALRNSSLKGKTRPAIKAAVTDVNEEFGSRSKFSAQLNVNHFAQNVENATRDAMDELLRKMRIQIRRGAEDEDSFENVAARLRERYDDANLRQRAELIAHMELKNAVETTKLQLFEQSPEVIGVRVSNSNPSTPLTEALAGVEAMFDSEDSVQEQLSSATRSEFLHSGFNPLPSVPPFHFNDSSELEPITEKEE